METRRFEGEPLGYNVRLAKASPLAKAILQIEEKWKNYAEVASRFAGKSYAFFKIRGNEKVTTTM